jgi:hypothetical protein
MYRAVARHAGKVAKHGLQKVRELAAGHFARGHGELAMFDPPEAADMAGDGHVVGWVGEGQVGDIAGHQRVEGRGLKRIAADQAMIAEAPDIAEPGDGGPARHRGVDLVLGPGWWLAQIFQAPDWRSEDWGVR